jgi:hypothetical protein
VRGLQAVWITCAIQGCWFEPDRVPSVELALLADSGTRADAETLEDSGATDATTADSGCVCGQPGCSDASCVECTLSSQCGETEPVCKSNQCQRCSAANDCSARAATPACQQSTGECVECTAQNKTACVNSKVACDTATNRCVECTTNADCADPTKSVCDTQTHTCKPCSDSSSSDCTHIKDKNVCAANVCVQCTRDKRTACKTADNAPAVCDSITKTCSPAGLTSTDVCGECVSDDQCKTGQRCVLTRYENSMEVGWFCQWERKSFGALATCDPQARPFAGTTQMPSRDAPTEMFEMCTTRSTCPAYNKFANACGRYTNGALTMIVQSSTDPNLPVSEHNQPNRIAPDSAECGMGGTCVAQNAGLGAYRCTYACLNTITHVDCKSGVTCGSNSLCVVP